MRCATEGFGKYRGVLHWTSVDEATAALHGGIALPKPALHEDVVATEQKVTGAAGALANFAKEGHARRVEILESGAVPSLVHVLKTMSEHPRSAAAWALAELMATDGSAVCCAAVAEAGAIPPLVAMLRQGAAARIGQGVDDGREDASGFKGSERWEMGDVRAAVFVDERGKRRAMHDGAPRPITIERSARALRGLSLSHRNAVAMGRCGAVKPLLQLMQNAISAETRSACGNCLVSLAACDEYRNALGRLGALAPFVKMMQQGQAAAGKGLRALGGRTAKKHASDALMASCAVRNLLFNAGNKALFVEQGGIEVLVGMMRRARARTAEKAVSALAHLAKNRANRHAMVRAGAVRALAPHLDADDRKLRDTSFELLAQLGFAVEVHELLELMHPLMGLLSSEFASERILAASVLANVTQTDEHKCVAAQGMVVDAGLLPHDRKKVREWKKARARKLSKMRLAAVLQRYRKSRADATARDEAAKWRADYEMEEYFRAEEIGAFQTQFMAIDADESGAIDEAEMATLLAAMGEAPHGAHNPGSSKDLAFRKRVRHMIAEVDDDGSGRIEFNEFLHAMRHIRESRKGVLGRVAAKGGITGGLAKLATASTIGLLRGIGAVPAEDHTWQETEVAGPEARRLPRGSVTFSRPALRTLVLGVHNCRNLAVTESPGANDVYVTVEWGGKLCGRHEVGQTATCADTLDPEWGSAAASHGKAAGAKRGVCVAPESFRVQLPARCEGFSLRCSAWDDDMGKLEFLGEVVLPAEALEARAQEPQPRGMPLRPLGGASGRKNRFVGGTLALTWHVEDELGGTVGDETGFEAEAGGEAFDAAFAYKEQDALTDAVALRSSASPSASGNANAASVPDGRANALAMAERPGGAGGSGSGGGAPLPPMHAHGRQVDGAPLGELLVTVPKGARPMQRITVHLPGAPVGRVAETAVPEGKVEGMTFVYRAPAHLEDGSTAAGRTMAQPTSAAEVARTASQHLHCFALEVHGATDLISAAAQRQALAMKGARAWAEFDYESAPQPMPVVVVHATVDDGKTGHAGSGHRGGRFVELGRSRPLPIGEQGKEGVLGADPRWEDAVFHCQLPEDLTRAKVTITVFDESEVAAGGEAVNMGQVTLAHHALMRLSGRQLTRRLADRAGRVAAADPAMQAVAEKAQRKRLHVARKNANKVHPEGGVQGGGAPAEVVSAAIAARVKAAAAKDAATRKRRELRKRRLREIEQAQARLAVERQKKERVDRQAAALTKHWRARRARRVVRELLGRRWERRWDPVSERCFYLRCRHDGSSYTGNDVMRWAPPLPTLLGGGGGGGGGADLPLVGSGGLPRSEQAKQQAEEARSLLLGGGGGGGGGGEPPVLPAGGTKPPSNGPSSRGKPPAGPPPRSAAAAAAAVVASATAVGSPPPSPAPLGDADGRVLVVEGVRIVDGVAQPPEGAMDFERILEVELRERFAPHELSSLHARFSAHASSEPPPPPPPPPPPVAQESGGAARGGGAAAAAGGAVAADVFGMRQEGQPTVDEFELLDLVNGLTQSSDLAPWARPTLRALLLEIDADAVGAADFSAFLALVDARRVERRQLRRRREAAYESNQRKRIGRLLAPPPESEGEEEQSASSSSDDAEDGGGLLAEDDAAKRRAAEQEAQRAADKSGVALEVADAAFAARQALDPWRVDPATAQHFSPEELDALKAQFGEADEDKSGTVDEVELRQLLRGQGDEVSVEKVKELMRFVATDAPKGRKGRGGGGGGGGGGGMAAVDFNEFVGLIAYRMLEDKDVVEELGHPDGSQAGGGDDEEEYEYVSEYTVELEGEMADDKRYAVPRRLQRAFTREQIARYKGEFKSIDSDGSGALCEAELRVLVDALGEHVEDEQLTEMMAEVDADASGEVDFGEFLAMMHDLRSSNAAGSKLGALVNRAGVEGVLRRGFSGLKHMFRKPQKPDPEKIVMGAKRSLHRARRLADRERELREQLEYAENGSVTLLVDMLRSSIEMAKENALAALLDFSLHDKVGGGAPAAALEWVVVTDLACAFPLRAP